MNPLRLPTPPDKYDPTDQAAFRRALEAWAAQVVGTQGPPGPAGPAGTEPVPSLFHGTGVGPWNAIASGAGVLRGINLNNSGLTEITIWDSLTAGTGTQIGLMFVPSGQSGGEYFDFPFSVGLSVSKLSGTVNDVWVSYTQ